MKRFIYQFFQKMKDKIKALHNIILLKKENQFEIKFNRNYYGIFFDWIIDILQYGTLLAITLIILNINLLTLLKWVMPLGVLRWLVFDTIKEYKKIK